MFPSKFGSVFLVLSLPASIFDVSTEAKLRCVAAILSFILASANVIYPLA